MSSRVDDHHSHPTWSARAGAFGQCSSQSCRKRRKRRAGLSRLASARRSHPARIRAARAFVCDEWPGDATGGGQGSTDSSFQDRLLAWRTGGPDGNDSSVRGAHLRSKSRPRGARFLRNKLFLGQTVGQGWTLSLSILLPAWLDRTAMTSTPPRGMCRPPPKPWRLAALGRGAERGSRGIFPSRGCVLLRLQRMA